MTFDQMEQYFDDQANKPYTSFEETTFVKRSKRPDIHAFLLLDELLPDDTNIICSAEHDQVWLSTDEDKLAAVITQEQIAELTACGVWLDKTVSGLTMYV